MYTQRVSAKYGKAEMFTNILGRCPVDDVFDPVSNYPLAKSNQELSIRQAFDITSSDLEYLDIMVSKDETD